MGFSPGLSKEVAYRANLDHKSKLSDLDDQDIDKLYQIISELMDNLQNGQVQPSVLIENDKIIDFHLFNLTYVENSINKEFSNISQSLDFYYSEKDTLDRVSQKSQSTRKIVQNNLDKNTNKLDKLEKELEESRNRDIYKVYADLISANIYQIPKGANSVDLQNFYDENIETISIPLDIKLSPALNAQKYYKKYSKLKTASILLEDQINDTKAEILYLDNVLLSLEQAENVTDIDEIKEELIAESYIKTKINKKKKTSLSKPMTYISSDGYTILVGKNNRQNDELTLKTARKDDLWLHVQTIPGSHVIIQTNGHEVPRSTLEEAALLAGYYSKGRNSTALSVDYTEKKHVKKSKGAKLGMVFYNEFNTIIVNASEENFNKIKNRAK